MSDCIYYYKMVRFANSPLLALLIVGLVVLTCSQNCLPGCLSCSTPYNCNSCTPGQSCCAPTCATCVNQLQCTQCQPSYTLNSSANLCYLTNSCLQMTCNQCSSTTNVCTSCSAGYYLDQYTYVCGACPNACVACTAASVCTQCA